MTACCCLARGGALAKAHSRRHDAPTVNLEERVQLVPAAESACCWHDQFAIASLAGSRDSKHMMGGIRVAVS